MGAPSVRPRPWFTLSTLSKGARAVLGGTRNGLPASSRKDGTQMGRTLSPCCPEGGPGEHGRPPSRMGSLRLRASVGRPVRCREASRGLRGLVSRELPAAGHPAWQWPRKESRCGRTPLGPMHRHAARTSRQTALSRRGLAMGLGPSLPNGKARPAGVLHVLIRQGSP
jgi:hypothetical protein